MEGNHCSIISHRRQIVKCDSYCDFTNHLIRERNDFAINSDQSKTQSENVIGCKVLNHSCDTDTVDHRNTVDTQYTVDLQFKDNSAAGCDVQSEEVLPGVLKLIFD